MTDEETLPIRLFIAAALFPDAAAFLKAHGCTIESQRNTDGTVKTTVTLPPGSTKKFLHGKVISDHFAWTLPDSVVIHQVYDVHAGTSAILVPAQIVSSAKEAADEQ